ncbi:MAG: hydantoinase B/oxoprolinase family protein [Hyphomicrobiales bacterium]|nr:hydantoinase B/oxoprolinase family protein [Hyphomicrobiales bacterium]
MTAPLDPVTLEIIRNSLPAIANEMAASLQRSSYNMMIYEVCDFCTALVDRQGQLIAQNVGGVSHFVADLGVVIEDAVATYGEKGFDPGDVIITNHQKVAGQHLNNIVVYVPFIDRDVLVGFAITRAHWIDVGGMSTGFGASPLVTDPWLEGLQLNQLKIYDAGTLNEPLLAVLRDNIRYAESSLGDLRAQIAACRLGVRRFGELFDKYGSDVVQASIETIFSETEARCRKVVAGIPDGIYQADAVYDDDGLSDEPVPIAAKVTVCGGDMTIDLSACSAQRKAGINARTLAAARVAYKALTEPGMPVNEGSFRALKVVIPEGNIMMARHPAPMGGWSLIIPTVVDTILRALAPAMPDAIPAAHHGLLGGSVIFFGHDPQRRRNFVVQSLEGGGWGAHCDADGESAAVSICQGNVRNSPIESLELKNPVLIEERALRADSGGPGRFRGGLGLSIKVRNLVEGKWNLARPRRQKCPPWGLWDGRQGQSGAYLLRLAGEAEFKPMDAVMYPVPPDSEMILLTGGGGGWGHPIERDPERVLEDVRRGFVTLAAARSDYGVVIEEASMRLDHAATRRLREQRRQDRT